MSTDKELLGAAAKAIAEHAAWKVRNSARNALKKFYRDYTDETGELFDRGDCVDGGEFEYVTKFDELSNSLKKEQRNLTTKRAATRRAIVRAAAAIGEQLNEGVKES
jgi:hypothetical protein